MKLENAQSVHEITTSLHEMNPIDLATRQNDTYHADVLVDDIAETERVLHGDPTLTNEQEEYLLNLSAELRLDWLYAAHGGQELGPADFSVQANEVGRYLQLAKEHALERRADDPRALWNIKIKQLDLRALQAYRHAQEAQTTSADSAANEQVWAVADSQLRSVIIGSTNLMLDLDRYVLNDDDIAKKARGTLYEVMLTAYARLKLYEGERFDEVFVRTSLNREDRPILTPKTPNRAIDLVLQGDLRTNLIQVKASGHNSKYEKLIEVVYAENIAELIRAIPQYVDDFRTAMTASDDPAQIVAQEQAFQRLEATFESQMAELYVA